MPKINPKELSQTSKKIQSLKLKSTEIFKELNKQTSKLISCITLQESSEIKVILEIFQKLTLFLEKDLQEEINALLLKAKSILLKQGKEEESIEKLIEVDEIDELKKYIAGLKKIQSDFLDSEFKTNIRSLLKLYGDYLVLGSSPIDKAAKENDMVALEKLLSALMPKINFIFKNLINEEINYQIKVVSQKTLLNEITKNDTKKIETYSKFFQVNKVPSLTILTAHSFVNEKRQKGSLADQWLNFSETMQFFIKKEKNLLTFFNALVYFARDDLDNFKKLELQCDKFILKTFLTVSFNSNPLVKKHLSNMTFDVFVLIVKANEENKKLKNIIEKVITDVGRFSKKGNNCEIFYQNKIIDVEKTLNHYFQDLFKNDAESLENNVYALVDIFIEQKLWKMLINVKEKFNDDWQNIINRRFTKVLEEKNKEFALFFLKEHIENNTLKEILLETLPFISEMKKEENAEFWEEILTIIFKQAEKEKFLSELLQVKDFNLFHVGIVSAPLRDFLFAVYQKANLHIELFQSGVTVYQNHSVLNFIWEKLSEIEQRKQIESTFKLACEQIIKERSNRGFQVFTWIAENTETMDSAFCRQITNEKADKFFQVFEWVAKKAETMGVLQSIISANNYALLINAVDLDPELAKLLWQKLERNKDFEILTLLIKQNCIIDPEVNSKEYNSIEPHNIDDLSIKKSRGLAPITDLYITSLLNGAKKISLNLKNKDLFLSLLHISEYLYINEFEIEKPVSIFQQAEIDIKIFRQVSFVSVLKKITEIFWFKDVYSLFQKIKSAKTGLLRYSPDESSATYSDTKEYVDVIYNLAKKALSSLLQSGEPGNKQCLQEFYDELICIKPFYEQNRDDWQKLIEDFVKELNSIQLVEAEASDTNAKTF